MSPGLRSSQESRSRPPERAAGGSGYHVDVDQDRRTFPLTGPASLYKTIPAAEKAYFDYVNDHGGVNGRKIDFTSSTTRTTRRRPFRSSSSSSSSDKVFAVYGSLGTAPGLATWDYLNQQKVPQVLLATGDSYWGFSAKKYPWTTGWQPDYPGEAKAYGRYINANAPNAKIGVLFQNDAYGKNYYAGLRVGLGAKKTNIVDAESYDVTSPSLTQQILALKSKGADTFVIFATPTPTITALVTATKVGWTPSDDVDQQRLGEPPLPPGGGSERRERRRRDLDLVRRKLDDAAGSSGRQARDLDHQPVRTLARPQLPEGRREHHVRASAPRGRWSTRSNTRARPRRGPA